MLVAGAQAGDHVEQLVPDPRVEADGRLVQEQHARLGDERAGDLQPPALRRRCSSPTGPVEISARPSASASSRIAPSRRPRLDPHSRACRSRFARPVRPRSTTASWKTTLLTPRAWSGWRATSKPASRRVPAVGDDRGGEHPDGGRLARAVGAEQAEHLARRDVEVDAPDGLDAARGRSWRRPVAHDRPLVSSSQCPWWVSQSSGRNRGAWRVAVTSPAPLVNPGDGSEREDVTDGDTTSLAARVRAAPTRSCAPSPTGCSAPSSEAEDAVQEAWLRLSRSDADAIANLGGWLTTVVARVSPGHAARPPRAPRGLRRELAARADGRVRARVRRARARRRCWRTPSGWRCSSCSRRSRRRNGSRSSCTTCSPCRSTRSRRSSAARRPPPASSPAARGGACAAPRRRRTPIWPRSARSSTRSWPPRGRATSTRSSRSCIRSRVPGRRLRPRAARPRRSPAPRPSRARCSPRATRFARFGRHAIVNGAAGVVVARVGETPAVVLAIGFAGERIVAIDVTADPERTRDLQRGG